MGAETTLLVCVTCRRASSATGSGASADAAARPGALLFDALAATPLPGGMRLRPVECLSACSNGCAIALAGPGRWTYVYGNLDPAEHSAEILAGAQAYAATKDGLVPWRERPPVFRRNAIARVPPFEMDPS